MNQIFKLILFMSMLHFFSLITRGQDKRITDDKILEAVREATTFMEEKVISMIHRPLHQILQPWA